MTFTIEQLAKLVREFPTVYADECALRLLEQQAYIASLEKELQELKNKS